jgi:CDP-diacylglycerol--serine O-phosphatidyltransferase
MPRRITVLLPNTATLSSLMLGVVAIMLLSEQKFLIATIFIMLGAVLDVLDGQLAERLGATSDIGKQLDSLADVVTFGVAPTILIYYLMLHVGVIQPIAIASSLAFVVAGAFRLARFNTIPSDRNAHFKGMPIPMGSALLITGTFWQGWTISLWWALVVLMVSYLMVSPFPYPKSKHILAYPPLIWLAVIVAAMVGWFMAGWQAVPFGLMIVYAVSGPILSTFFTTRRRIHEHRARKKQVIVNEEVDEEVDEVIDLK